LESKISLALVGAGYWGKNLARVYHELGVLKYICDPSVETLKRKSKKYPEVKTTVSFSKIIASPEINAIAIAAPAEKHYSLAKKALLAKKHVFVEKPLAIKTEEGEELVELAKTQNQVLFVGHILHYHTAIQTIKSMIKKGELGKLQYIYSNRLNLGKIRKEENILWSFAPHDISVILSLVGEEPSEVSSSGSNILQSDVADTTVTKLKFPSGAQAHIFVSWLHPFKEQKLVIVGEGGMIVFDDTAPIDKKLVLYSHQIAWENGTPVPKKEEGTSIDLTKQWEEPLKEEALAFIRSTQGQPALTDGEEGLKVLKVLHRAQISMDTNINSNKNKPYFIHPTSVVDEYCQIGKDCKIWHFSHILKNSILGKKVNIGQNVVIGPNVKIGDNVKIQNNVSVYEGVTLENNVFCGPSCVFTNVINPRSSIPRKKEILPTLVRENATIGANATILCGITIGQYSFIGAGAVVTKDVPSHALIYGNPASQHGWICVCGYKLNSKNYCTYCKKTIDIT